MKAQIDVEKQREILGALYNDYVAFCRSRGSEPMPLDKFIELEIKLREEESK